MSPNTPNNSSPYKMFLKLLYQYSVISVKFKITQSDLLEHEKNTTYTHRYITTYFIQYRQVTTAIASTTIRLLLKLDCLTNDGCLSTEILYFLTNCHRPFCHCCAHGEVCTVKGNCHSVLGFYCHWNTGSLRLGHRNIWKCAFYSCLFLCLSMNKYTAA